jgi:lipid-A-disaccharide synthase
VIPALNASGFDVSLRILPCQYAAGNETLIARNIGAVDVAPPMSVFRSLVEGEKEPPEAVLQMGGDLLFGLALSARNRVPLLCYTYGSKPLLLKCDQVLTAFEQTRHNILPGCDKVFVAGDLVADSLAMDHDEFSWPGRGRYRVVFFPGSRRAIRSVALPFIKAIGDSLMQRLPEVETVTALSPFSSREEIDEWRDNGLAPSTASAGSILKGADLAITQPGTNTLEMAYTGTPGIVTIPFAFLRQVPLPGIQGLLASIPFAGPLMKERALRMKSRNRGFLAWPNRLAGREVMPEMVGDLTPEDIAGAASELLLDSARLASIRTELAMITQKPGTAGRIAFRIAEMVG